MKQKNAVLSIHRIFYVTGISERFPAIQNQMIFIVPDLFCNL